MFNLKRFVLDELSGYWVSALNKVPVLKVLILDDLPGHLEIIPESLTDFQLLI